MKIGYKQTRFSVVVCGLKSLSLVFLCYLFSANVFSQSNNVCANPKPFCTGQTMQFSANTNAGQAQTGPNYGCASGLVPNPSWFYFQMGTTGPIVITITAPSDVDFVCWGPFSNLNGNCGNLNAGAILDCGISPTNTETVNFTGIAGQYYFLMITNWYNINQQITFSQTNLNVPGAGQTNCSVLCNMSVTATSSVCSGQTASLSVLTGTNIQSVVWSGPNNFSSTATNVAIPSMSVSGNYTCVATNTGTNPATNTCAVTQSITVIQIPTVSIINNGPVCEGQAATFTASGASSYTWTGPNSYSAAASSPTIQNVQLNSAGVYSIQASTSGCSTTTTSTLLISANPSLTVSGSGSYCVGQNASLTVSGANNYSWLGPNNYSSSQQNPNINLLIQNTSGTYSVIGSIGSCSTLATVSVLANALPTVSATNNSPLCVGSTLQLNTSSAMSYTWLGPNNFTSSVQNPTIINTTLLSSGVYSITITDAIGCSNTASTNIIINPNPTPLIGSNSPVCLNNTISLTSGGGTAYFWSGPNSFVSAIQNPNVVASSTTMSGVYTVTVTDVNSCQNTATISIIVNTPTTIANNTGPYCAGSNILLNTATANSYTWTGPSAYVSNSQNPVIIASNLSMGGIYTVAVSVGGCTAVATTSVIVNSLPTIFTNTNITACTNSNVVLNATGAITYTWAGPNNYLSTGASATISNVSTLQGGIYTITATDVNNCVNTSSTAVTIYPNPTISVTGATVCVGTSATLTSSGGVNYNWLGPNGYSSTQQNPIISAANALNEGGYTVTVNSVNSCNAAGVVSVAINPLPQPSATTTAKACINTVVSMEANAGYLSYNWIGPNGFLSNNAEVNFIPDHMNQSGTYTLLVLDINNCVGSTTASLVLYPLPEASIKIEKDKQCIPFCTNIILQPAMGSSSIITSNWIINEQNFNGLTTNYCVANSGNQTIKSTFIDANGCMNSSFHTITGYDLPVADFEFSPNNPTESENEVQFTDKTIGSEITSWNWYFINNTNYSAVQNPNYTFGVAGTYPIVLVVSNKYGCSDTIVKTINVNLGTDFYVPNAFSPNADGVNDVFLPKGYNITKYDLGIYDSWGEQLFYTTNFSTGWDGSFKGNNCKQGVYIWKINVTKGKQSPKMFMGNITLIR